MAKHSKSEREQLISDFKSSGLSMTKWCQQNKLPVSTVSGWMKTRHKNTAKESATTFIEIKPQAPASNLKISIGCVDVIIDNSTDMGLLTRLIKAVNEVNV